MEDKSYSQMKQEFIEFYHNEVKETLKEYNKDHNYIHLKGKFMNKFLSIFFPRSHELDIEEAKSVYNDNYYKKLKEIRKQHILNPFPILKFDDVIFGIFKNVKIKIFETDTNPTIALILITFIILPPFISGMFDIAYLKVLIFFLLVALLFSRKIFQYSPFQGVIIEFNMNKPFKGHTFFHENSLRAKKIPFNKKKYKKVNLESVTFEKKYNVYSDDQVEGRYLFTTAFMERIENLSFAFKAKYVRGSFKDDKLVLAIHTGKDMYAMNGATGKTDARTFEILFDEMISVLQIVDALKLNEHTGL